MFGPPGLAILAGVLAACTTEPFGDREAVCSSAERLHLPIRPAAAGDVLIVVDRSASMTVNRDRVAELARSIGRVATELDLHVGVVSSDLGGLGVPGCEGRRDDAALLRAAECGVDGAFIRTGRLADRGQRDNAGGDVARALECMMALPTSTCAVNQPLAAALAAVDGSRPDNDGFRHPGAPLLVFVVTDADDCSLAASDTFLTSGLPLTTEPEVDRACRALGQTGWLADAQATLDRAIGTSGFVAIVAPVNTRTCSSGQAVVEARRLRSLRAPERMLRFDACSPSWSDAAGGLQLPFREPLPGFCLDASADLEPTIPGAQVECTFVAHLGPSGDARSQQVPRCGGDDDGLCVRVGTRDTAACPLGISIDVEHRPLAESGVLDVECVTRQTCEP